MRESRLTSAVSLAPCAARRERALLQRWLAAPHVRRWWGDPARNLDDLLSSPVSGGEALIEVAARPVGYVRWQIPSRAELVEAGLDDLPEGTLDIDIAIGEPAYLGQGVASQALRLLVRRLIATHAPPAIIICTAVDNLAALRAYEAAGFVRDRIFEDPQFGAMWCLLIRTAATPSLARPRPR